MANHVLDAKANQLGLNYKPPLQVLLKTKWWVVDDYRGEPNSTWTAHQIYIILKEIVNNFEKVLYPGPVSLTIVRIKLKTFEAKKIYPMMRKSIYLSPPPLFVLIHK